MCMPFTEEEIRHALFSIPNVKSPGPDGFSGGFFKSTRHMTRSLICEAIYQFFKTGEMPAFISATKLTVLPKVHNPQKAAEFRPISRCNVTYKYISKLLCQRIKVILPTIINQCHGAFVKGREFLYNVLIC